jgi:hypothetical protein
MIDELTIYFHPLGGQTGNEVERACYADIGLAVGEQWLTQMEDRFASTVSRHLRASIHQLATWFAANWWRLRWEPETRDWSTDVGWRMAHSVASAGGGFVWPNVLFASDGDTVAIASRPRANTAAFEPIRYLNRFDSRITAADFENKVDLFIGSVISRLRDLGIKDDALPVLWAEVMAERQDPEGTQWRKLEALAGYDPDEIPEGLAAKLLEDERLLGKGAVEEVAAEARQGVDSALQPMREVSRSRKPKAGGHRVTIPRLNGTVPDDGRLPWQHAATLAALVRREWDLGNAPVLNNNLAELLSTTKDVFLSASAPRSKTPFAIRQAKEGVVDVYLHSPIAANRRFAIGRLLGDHLCCANGDRLLPATRARTVRQKFQRAFAQEFLCPYTALVERVQTVQPDEDDINEAAHYFHVSPLLVKTTLVNKGELDRTALIATGQLSPVAG